MTLNEVEDVVYKVIKDYFAGATVIWANQMQPQPKEPFVTIDIKNITRKQFTVNEDDFSRYYHCTGTLEVNLYTDGKVKRLKDGYSRIAKNTALSDLMAFTAYIESISASDELARNDMDIRLYQPVQDLTMLEQDTGFRPHAVAEFVLNYTMEANGMYGISGNPDVPTASGGGTEEMANTPIEQIEQVESEFITESEDNNDGV